MNLRLTPLENLLARLRPKRRTRYRASAPSLRLGLLSPSRPVEPPAIICHSKSKRRGLFPSLPSMLQRRERRLPWPPAPRHRLDSRTADGPAGAIVNATSVIRGASRGHFPLAPDCPVASPAQTCSAESIHQCSDQRRGNRHDHLALMLSGLNEINCFLALLEK